MRRSFSIEEGDLVSYIHDEVSYKQSYETAEEKDFNTVFEEFIDNIDLSKAPLFKAKLLKFSEQRHLFLLNIHHIIFDGTSCEILMNELLNFYNHNNISCEPDCSQNFR